MSENIDSNLFLGRQPILDRDQKTIGYEFLFRHAATDFSNIDEGSAAAATADVVCNAFAELGLAGALGQQRAFIKVDADFLRNDNVLLLPAETVVLELDVAQEPAPEVIARCQELHGAGYLFSISSVTALSDGVRRLLEIADYAKVDILDDVASLNPVVSQLHAAKAQVIAMRVETPEKLQIARDLGCDAYQGYFFARPALMSGRKLGAGTQTLIRLVNLLNEDADLARVESVIKGEPGLVANMLRLTNSVAMGLPTKVTSVRQAITVLGRRQMQRWLQLLLFSRPGGPGMHANPLMQLAALRGCFLELLVQRCYPARREWRDPAFIVGLMSVMPAALEMPMAEILQQIAVAPEVREALESHGGPLGQLLELVENYDDNNVAAAAQMLGKLGGKLGQQTLNLCLTEAIAWVLSLANEA